MKLASDTVKQRTPNQWQYVNAAMLQTLPKSPNSIGKFYTLSGDFLGAEKNYSWTLVPAVGKWQVPGKVLDSRVKFGKAAVEKGP